MAIRSVLRKATPAFALSAALALPALAAAGTPWAAVASRADISFPVSAMTWHRLRLSASWAADPTTGTGTPSYAVKNGIVHLAGAVEQQRGGTTFGYLPKGARPSRNLYIEVYSYGGAV